MIKLGAEFDGRSLSTASGDIARAIAEGVKTGVSDGLKGAFGGADFTVAASRFADSLNGAISKIDFGKSLNIGDALAGTNSVLTELTGQLDGVRKAIEQTVSSFNDIGRRGADGIDTIIASMRELNNLVQQINSKSFNVVNQFSVDGLKSASDGITLYRDQARALIDTLDEMYNAMMNSSAAGKIAIDAWKKLSGDGGMNLKSMRSVVDNDNTSLTKLQMLINSGERFKAIMEELISVEQRFDSSLALPDTTKFDAATQKIAEFEAQNARAEAAVTAAAEATVKASEKMAAATEALDTTTDRGTVSGASAEKAAQASAVAKAENAEAAAAKETIKAEREATDVALEAAYAKEEKAKAAREVEQAEHAEAAAAKAIAKASASAAKSAAKALSDTEVANKKVVSSQEKAVTSAYEKLERQMGGDSRFAEIAEAYKKYEEAVSGIKRGPVSDNDVAKVTALRNALMEQIQALENSAKAHDQNSEATKKDAEMTEAQAAVVKKQAANLNRQITEQLRRVPGLDDSDLGARLKEIQKELSGKDIDPTRLKELSAEVAEIKDGYTQAGYAGTGFFTTLSSGLRNVAGFTAMVAGLRKVISVIKQMTAAIKEVDAAMTELRKVTSMTAVGYDDFLKRAGTAAKQIGATVSDTVNATADFARLGYDPGEALELAQAALVYKNVGDGIDDVSQATESLISTIKAFRLEASDATMVIDEFNEVGNRFAISSTGIGDALVRSASALQGAGNSLEESIGLITAANAIVQNPESVGTSMKTLTMYLRAAKPDLEALGEDAEDCANSVAELREKLMALTGVDIMIDDSTFKSTYQIMQEISKEWENIADVDKAAVTKLIGGKRNANVVQALLTNFQDAERVVETAQNAIGSAAAENEEYLGSIAGKLDLLKANYQQLAEAVIGSRIVKVGVDVLNVLMQIATVIGGMPAAFKYPLIMLTGMLEVSTLFPKTLGVIQKAFDALSITSIKSFMGANPWAPWVVGATAVVGVIVNLVDGMNRARDAAIEAANESAKAFADENETYEGNIKKLDDLKERYYELAEGVDEHGKNVGLTANEYAEYKDIVSQIVDISPSIVSGYDSEGNAMLKYRDAISGAKKELKELHAEQAGDYFAGQDSRLSAWRNEYEAASKKVAGHGGFILEEFFNNNAVSNGRSGSGLSWYDTLDVVIDKMNELGIVTDERAKELKEFTSMGEIPFLEHDEITALYDYNEKLGDLLSTVTILGKDGKQIRLFSPTEVQEVSNAIRQLGGDIKDEREKVQKYSNDIRQYIEEQKKFQDIGNAPWFESFWAQIDEISAKEIDAGKDAKSAAELQVEAMELLGTVANTFSGNDVVKHLDDISKQYLNGAISLQEYEKEIDNLDATLRLGAIFDPTTFENDYGSLADPTVAAIVLDYYRNIATIMPKVGGAAGDAAPQIKGFSDALKQLNDSAGVLEKAMAEMESGNGISSGTIDTIRGMLTDGEHLSDYLYREGDAVKLNAQAWEERSRAIAENDLAGYEAKLSETRSQLDEAIRSAYTEGMQNGFVSQEQLDLIDKLQQKVKDLEIEVAAYQAMLANDTGDDPLNLTQMFTDIDEVEKKSSELVNALQEINDGTVQSMAELAAKYPQLMDIPGLRGADSPEKQAAIIRNALDEYQQEIYGIIDAQIEAVSEMRDAALAEGEDTAPFDTLLDNLAFVRQSWTLTRNVFKKDDPFEALSKSLSKANSYADIIKDAQDGVDLDLLVKMRDTFGETWKDMMLTDGAGNYIGINIQQMHDLIAAELDLEGENADLKDAFEQMWAAALKGDDVKTQFEQISDAMSRAGSVTDLAAQYQNGGMSWDFIEKARNTLGEDADKYFSKGADGIEQFDVELLRINERAKLVASGVGPMILSWFDSTWESSMRAANGLDALSSAFGNADKVGQLMADIKSGSKSDIDIFESLISIAKDSGADVWDFIESVDADGIHYNLEKITEAQTGFLQSVQEYEDVHPEVSGITEYLKGLMDATENADKLGDALSNIEKAISIVRSSVSDGVSMNTINSLRELFSEDWESYLITDDAGNYIAVDTEKVYGFIEAQEEAGETSAGVNAIIAESWSKAGEGIDDAADSFAHLTDAISKLQSTYKLLNSIRAGSGSFTDQLNSIIEIAKDGGYSISDLVSFDAGAFVPNTDRIAEYQASIFSWDNLKDIPGMTKKIAVGIQDLTTKELDAAAASEKFNNAISATSKARGLLDNIRSGNGDFFSMFQTAMEMAEESGKSIDDFFDGTKGELGWSERAVTEYAMTWIDSLGEISNASDDTIEYMKQLLQQQLEVATAAERAERALSSTATATQAVANVGVNAGVSYEQFRSLLEISTDYAQAIEYNNGKMTVNRDMYQKVTASVLKQNLVEAENLKYAIMLGDEYKTLTQNLKEYGSLSDTDQDRLDSLNAEIMAYEVLANDIRDAASAYQQFLGADTSINADQFDAAAKAFQVIQDTLYNKDSDMYGLVGREQYREAVEFLIRPEVDVDDAKKTLERYFSEAASGADHFVEDLKKNGFIDASGQINTTANEIADSLGLTVDGVLAMIAQVNQGLEEPFQLKVQVAYSEDDVAGLEDRIDNVKKTIEELQDGTIDINSDEGQKKLAEIDSEILNVSGHLNEMQKYGSGDLDLSGLTSSIADVQSDVNTLKESIPTADDTKAEVDTSAADSALDATKGKVDGISNAIDGLSDHPVKIDTNAAQSAVARVSTAINGILTKLNQLNGKVFSFTIQRNGNANIPSGGGTTGNTKQAGVSGTSMAPGFVGAPGGETLVGELGTEIVVDPATNKWYTVGEHGAEFIDMPAGAIVFNAEQTKMLLSNGKIGGRGYAMASGNAAAGLLSDIKNEVSGKLNTVSGNLANWKSKSTGQPAKGKTSSTRRSTNSSNDAEEAKSYAKDLFDWIEVAIARVERTISNLSKTATDTFKTLSTRLSATDKEIRKVNKEIDIQQKGAKRYMQEANKVDLSSDLKQRVQNGTIDINEYDDDTKERISNYQQWYEKALACRDAVKDLTKNLSELYSDKFEMVEKRYENRLSTIENTIDTLDNTVSASEYTGEDKPFKKMVSARQSSIKILNKEAVALQKQFDEAVSSGAVKKGSEEWYEMRNAIASVKSEAQKAKIEIASLYKEAFEDVEGKYDNQMSTVSNELTSYQNVSTMANYTGGAKPFQKMIDAESTGLQTLNKEADDLQKKLDEALASGAIKKGSDAWYDMRNAIASVKASAQESAINIAKYYRDMFDDIESRYNDMMGVIDHDINHINNLIKATDYTGGTAPYADSIDSSLDKVRTLNSEISDLEGSLANALNSGSIVEGSHEWYDMMGQINAKYEELDQLSFNISDAFVNSFNEIKGQYDNVMAMSDYALNYLEKVNEASQYNGGPRAYDQMIAERRNSLETLQSEMGSLERSMQAALDSGAITKGSKKWFEMQQQINAVELKIKETGIEISKTYGERFDYIKGQFDTLLSMSDKLSHVVKNMSSMSGFTGATQPRAETLDIAIANVRINNDAVKRLEDELSKAVNDGAITVGSDEWLKKRMEIESYRQSAIEASIQISQTYKDAFDDVGRTFGNVTSLIDQEMTRLENDVNASVYSGIAKPLSDMIDLQRERLVTLEKELPNLERALKNAIDSGAIKEGSDEWYAMKEQIAKVKAEIQSTGTEISKLFKDIFDDVEHRYDRSVSLLGGLTDLLNSGLSEIEARGYVGGTKLYQELAKIEEKNILTQQSKLDDLEQAMANAINSGEIKEGSDAWFEMQNTIVSVKKSIQDAGIELVNYAKAIRQIEWDRFDRARDSVAALTEETEFLIKLMDSSTLFDDHGQPTGTGNAQIGLHAVNYDVYMDQADKYADEVKRLNDEINNDLYDTELIDRRDQLLKLQRESILAAEQEKEAVADLVEQGIKKELESLSELINRYEDALSEARDLYEYQKNIESQTKGIASLQKQLSAYSGDNSEENRARVQRLQVDLSEALDKLEETQYDRYISDQKKVLDDLYSDYEMVLNQRLDDIDLLMNEMIASTNMRAGEIRDAIVSETSQVGISMTDNMNAIWAVGESTGNIVSQYVGDQTVTLNTTLGSVISGISQATAALFDHAGTINQTLIDYVGGVETAVGNVDAMIGNVWNSVEGVGAAVGGVEGAVNGVVDAVGNVEVAIGNGNSVIDNIKVATENANEKMEAANNAIGDMDANVTDAINAIDTVSSTSFEGLKTDFNTAKEEIGSKIDGQTDSEVALKIDGIDTSIQNMKDAADTNAKNIVDEIAKIIPEINGLEQYLITISADADAAKKAAEEEAQRQAEAEAAKKAEEEAARKAAEEEAARKAAEEEAAAAKKAEAEAEAEARKKAEAGAKKKTEAETKKKAEAGTKKKAKAEAKKKDKSEAKAKSGGGTSTKTSTLGKSGTTGGSKGTGVDAVTGAAPSANSAATAAVKAVSNIASGTSDLISGLGKAISTVGNALTNIAKGGKGGGGTGKGVKQVAGRAKGGYVAELQKIAYANGDDMITINTLKEGEAVLTVEQAKLFKRFATNLPQLVNGIEPTKRIDNLTAVNSSVIKAPSGVNVGEITVPISIEHVQDYNDFVRQLRDDKSFERMIQSITVDPLVGKSTLAKKKFYN